VNDILQGDFRDHTYFFSRETSFTKMGTYSSQNCHFNLHTI